MKLLLVLLGAALLLMGLATTALAATPSDIYNDFAADGDLDGNYTQAELNAVLTDATLAQYADSRVLDELKRRIRTGNPSSTVRGSFPFTGFEMGFAALIAVALVGGGMILRRTGR